MNNFKLAARSLFRRNRGNVIKIVSLALGLALGLVLLTKVFFERHYEAFYPDADRTYLVMATYVRGTGEDAQNKDDPTISGGVAPAMAREIPQVEAATRFFYLGHGTNLRKADRETVEADVIMADSCLFDVLPRPMVAGDAKKALATPFGAIVSRSLAQKLAGKQVDEAIGMRVEFDEFPGRDAYIEAIFEDIPLDSDYRYDMAISIASISSFTWDGSQRWYGNDRYTSFVRLTPGATADEMKPLMRDVQERNADMEALRRSGTDIVHWLMPLRKVHSDDPQIRQTNLLMTLLGLALLLIALLNYLIMTLSTVTARAREIAVCKCYGAGGGDIRRQVMAEAVFHVVLSLALAALLVVAFREQVQEVLKTPLTALFTWQGGAIVVGVCLGIIAVTTWIPSRLFAGVPAAWVMRDAKRSRRGWKLALLAMQFVFAAAFLAILVVIWRQYRMMVNDDPGYRYENLVYSELWGTDKSQQTVAVEKLRSMPGVEGVATSETLPFADQSGNNVSLPGSDREEFNFADNYWVDENYHPLMGIPIIEGHGFEKGVSTPTSDIMVSRTFAERISNIAGWTDGVVGKTLSLSEFGDGTVVGVYEDFLLGSLGGHDTRPSLFRYSDEQQSYIVVKLREVNGDTMREVEGVLHEAMPDKVLHVNSMRNTVRSLYDKQRIERNSIILCSLLTLAMVLLGLVGYLANDIGRRRAEIAIRRINGAATRDVLGLLTRDVLGVAVPALLAGSVLAWWVASRWIEAFAKRIALSPVMFGLTAAAVLAVILAVGVAAVWRISTRNPVDLLKKDD